ncbi:hypothetical protein [Erythrobacter ani]|uniref:Uncharacterized protein n=1 Tax=Erythrobacter ani TaxID=2827235 RepID=A0ABS6SPV4_9SPHN|nr:hypothetical protein [Erythrobacter ani]MBV7266423.1 hypothetical protein [Erythrobacter ani]
MSLNRLLYDHQIALMNAAAAEARAVRRDCVDHHENLIQKARQQLGVAQYPVARIRANAAWSRHAIAD